MRVVYKYPLKIVAEQVVLLPRDFEIIHVGIEYETPCLWALVESDNFLEKYEFFVVETGESLDNYPPCKYLGTAVATRFVWHIFQKDYI